MKLKRAMYCLESSENTGRKWEENDMAVIRVTAARLRSVADSLQEMNAQFKSRKQELTEKEQALSAMWEGQAKEAFHQAFIRDEQQMEAFYALIARYVQTLLEIAARYEQAEARNAEIAGSRSY